jgi:hypothetical protein
MADPTGNLRIQLMALLLSPPVQRINFRLGAYSVRGSDYSQIAMALFHGKINIAIDPAKLQSQKAGASYADGIFTFPSAKMGGTLWDRLAIVHESAHAIAHMHKIFWGSTDSEDEAAAYVADALYCTYIGFSATLSAGLSGEDNLLDPDKMVKNDVLWTAMTIAMKIKDTPGAVVPLQDAFAMRMAVIRNPTYVNMGITLGTLPVIHKGVWQ